MPKIYSFNLGITILKKILFSKEALKALAKVYVKSKRTYHESGYAVGINNDKEIIWGKVIGSEESTRNTGLEGLLDPGSSMFGLADVSLQIDELFVKDFGLKILPIFSLHFHNSNVSIPSDQDIFALLGNQAYYYENGISFLPIMAIASENNSCLQVLLLQSSKNIKDFDHALSQADIIVNRLSNKPEYHAMFYNPTVLSNEDIVSCINNTDYLQAMVLSYEITDRLTKLLNTEDVDSEVESAPCQLLQPVNKKESAEKLKKFIHQVKIL